MMATPAVNTQHPLLEGFKVRNVHISPGLVLAPMEGVTDLTFRRLIRQIGGCGLTVTEFISASNLSKDIALAKAMARFDTNERPVAIQLYGNDPEILGLGAKIVEDMGADIVDLNMGCPSKTVCSRSAGSALMKDMDLATKIVRSIRNATGLPFTVKMRAGWDQDHRNAPEMAHICEEEGVEAVYVHWRTRADQYGGERDLTVIRDVKSRVSIPVIANGDILDIQTAFDTLIQTGCDGLMIGRGAIRNPWIFQQIKMACNGQVPIQVTASERKRVLLAYFNAIQTKFSTDHGALGRMKKISRYFTEGVAFGELLRPAIFRSKTVSQAKARVESFFEELTRFESGEIQQVEFCWETGEDKD